MIRRWFNRKRRGAMAMVAVVGMMPVTSMFAANINASQIIDDRRHTQDAADAIAKTHAAWSARALNVIAMNNVTSAQLLTVAVGSEALDTTLTRLDWTALAQIGVIAGHGGIHCAVPRFNFWPADVAWAGFCGYQHYLVSVPALNTRDKIKDIRRIYDPKHGAELADKALKAIEGMNRALIERHPRAISEIAADYAQFYDVQNVHFAEPCAGPDVRNCQTTNSDDGMSLPIREGGMASNMEMCAMMRFGTAGTSTSFLARGFGAGRGPINHGGSPSNRNVKDHINHITDIGWTLQDYDRFYRSGLAHMMRHPVLAPRTTPAGNLNAIPTGRYKRSNFQLNTLRFYRRLPLLFSFDRNPLRFAFPIRQERNGTNDFKLLFEAKFLSICSGMTNVPIFGLAAEVPTLWELSGVTPGLGLTQRYPRDMHDDFRILTYVHKDESHRDQIVIPHLMGQVSHGRVAGHTGYAQTGLYNPFGASLYSQKWRSRLMPATRLDDVSDAAQDLNREATAAFDDLSQMLRAVSDQSTWGRIHAH